MAAAERGGQRTRSMSVAEGIAATLANLMAVDDRIFVMGEDVGRHGGVFRATAGLYERFGATRVRDTPICESAIVGVGLGAALVGGRPVIEIQYSDFLTECMDQIVNQAAKVRYMSGGQLSAPLVVRTPGGRSRSSAAQHSQSVESWFVNVPGLIVAGPSNVADACALLRSAVATDDPVLFFEHKLLYALRQPPLHAEQTVPLGQAAVYRRGTDVTVVAWSWMVQEALSAAQRAEDEFGASVEVLDLRTLAPLDIDAVVASVSRTGRLIVAHEAPLAGGWGADVVASVLERAWAELKAAPVRIGAAAVPVPMAPALESAVVPDAGTIAAAIKRLLGVGAAR